MAITIWNRSARSVARVIKGDNTFARHARYRPGYAEAHYNLGRLLAEKGESHDAINHYEAALALIPLMRTRTTILVNIISSRRVR